MSTTRSRCRLRPLPTIPVPEIPRLAPVPPALHSPFASNVTRAGIAAHPMLPKIALVGPAVALDLSHPAAQTPTAEPGQDVADVTSPRGPLAGPVAVTPAMAASHLTIVASSPIVPPTPPVAGTTTRRVSGGRPKSLPPATSRLHGRSQSLRRRSG